MNLVCRNNDLQLQGQLRHFLILLDQHFLLTIFICLVTKGDSMAYSISMAVTGDGDPRISLRIFWFAYYGRSCQAIPFIYGERKY